MVGAEDGADGKLQMGPETGVVAHKAHTIAELCV